MGKNNNTWIFINPENRNVHLIAVALATIFYKNQDDSFRIIHVSVVSKYFRGLTNVTIGYPDIHSNIVNIDVPEFLPFKAMCNYLEDILKLSHKNIQTPYLGFAKGDSEVDRYLSRFKNIVLFINYSVLNGIHLYDEYLASKIRKEGFLPICGGSRHEQLLREALDFRDLLSIENAIRAKDRIRVVVTSDPFIWEICMMLEIDVIFLFTHGLLLLSSEKRGLFEPIDHIREQSAAVLRLLRCESHDDIPSRNNIISHKFEVPYNFEEIILEYYSLRKDYIRYLYLPPFKDDLINARTGGQTALKGEPYYMPSTRIEYEQHLHSIKDHGLEYLVLWQDRNSEITECFIRYYVGFGASGFIVSSDKNAEIIKKFDPNLKVIGSITQCKVSGFTPLDLRNYDSIVMFYPFMRSLNTLAKLEAIKEKITIMPNSFCHTDCKGLHHWFVKSYKEFDTTKDCPAYRDESKSTFIYPEHLELFDSYVGNYKLQGREWSSDYIVTICESYFFRRTLDDLINSTLDAQLKHDISCFRRLSDYYSRKKMEIN